MKDSTKQIVKKINVLKTQVPRNWAGKVAERMNKSIPCVYAYSRGERGVKSGYPLQVLKHLLTIKEETEIEIEKYT